MLNVFGKRGLIWSRSWPLPPAHFRNGAGLGRRTSDVKDRNFRKIGLLADTERRNAMSRLRLDDHRVTEGGRPFRWTKSPSVGRDLHVENRHSVCVLVAPELAKYKTMTEVNDANS